MLLPLSQSVLAANVVLPTLATVAVVLRFMARRSRKLSLKADDYAILIALIIAVGICVSGIYAAAINIFAIPISKMSQKQYSVHEKLIWSDVLLCHLVYGVIKISIILFYKRIFVTHWFRVTTNIFMGVVVCWMVAAAFGHIFSANPVSKWWTSPPGFQTSIDYEIYLTAMAALDIALDTFTLLLPVPVINSLQMSKERKISVMGIFMLGFFCVVSSAVRLYYCWRLHLVVAHKIPRTEITSISAWNDVWAHIEACASIVTACLPALAPLFKGALSPESVITNFRTFLSLGSNSLFSTNKNRKMREDRQCSVESLGTKRNWYELSSTRTKSNTVGASKQQDDEALCENAASIKVEQSFGSYLESHA